MDKLINIQQFRPLADKMQHVRTPGCKADGEKDAIREAAREFEALFLRQLLAAMRKTVPDGGRSVPGASFYQGLADQELSRAIAGGNRGLQLADLLARQLGEMSEGNSNDQ